MKDLPRDILQCIGNTSLLPLRNIVPKNGSRILLKLENENPTGSMKDRMALAMASPPFFWRKKGYARLSRSGTMAAPCNATHLVF